MHRVFVAHKQQNAQHGNVDLKYLLSMEVQKAYEVPEDARLSGTEPGLASFSADGRRCWRLGKSKLLLWATEQETPIVMAVGLPFDMPHALVSAAAVKVTQWSKTAMSQPMPKGML